MYDEFYAKANELSRLGEPYVTAIVVRAEKPTSGKPGDKAIVTADGVMHGWIGGSCAQPAVIREALNALAEDSARLVRLSAEPSAQSPREGVLDLPMTCYSGGTLEVFIEPQFPRPRLLIVGTLPVARSLAHLGAAMNYHVIVVDPEGGGADIAHADEMVTDLEQAAAYVTPHTYVVVATHGEYDEPALETVLRATPPYVGLVASPNRAQAVRDYLARQGLSEAEMLPLKAPAGLDIQARRGDEIGLSIMAEIVQRRRNAELIDLALFRKRADAQAQDSAPVEIGAQPEEKATTDGIAIDPICHMEVEIATARFVSVYEETSYYFCCAGCKTRFDADPAAYTSSAAVDAAGHHH